MTKTSTIEEFAIATVTDLRWASLIGRDPSADGRFYYSVKTTGVYCRPSCAARMPRPENVAFHATRVDAERAGFRACKRCKPDQPRLAETQAAKITAVCRLIESSEDIPSLEALAAHAQMSVCGERFEAGNILRRLDQAAYCGDLRRLRFGQTRLVGLAALARAKTCALGVDACGVERDILRPRHARRTRRPAIHAGGFHRIVKPAIRA